MTCDRCYHEVYDETEHGIGLCPYEPRRDAPVVKPDTIVGGFLAENAWREPRYFDSQKAYEKALDDSGLMLKPRKSKASRTIDAMTLENAKALVQRTGTWTTRVLEADRD